MIRLYLAIIVWLAVALALAYLVGGMIRRGRRYPADPPTYSADHDVNGPHEGPSGVAAKIALD